MHRTLLAEPSKEPRDCTTNLGVPCLITVFNMASHCSNGLTRELKSLCLQVNRSYYRPVSRLLTKGGSGYSHFSSSTLISKPCDRPFRTNSVYCVFSDTAGDGEMSVDFTYCTHL